MVSSFFLILLLVGGGIWWLLNEREKKRAARGEPYFSAWRMLFAALAAMVALFAGGCSLLFLPDAFSNNTYVPWGLVAVVGGGPFIVAVLLLRFLLRRRDTLSKKEDVP